jgi:hypothetical protein
MAMHVQTFPERLSHKLNRKACPRIKCVIT